MKLSTTTLFTIIGLGAIAPTVHAKSDADYAVELAWNMASKANQLYGPDGSPAEANADACLKDYDQIVNKFHQSPDMTFKLTNSVKAPGVTWKSGETHAVSEIKPLCDKAKAAAASMTVALGEEGAIGMIWREIPAAEEPRSMLEKYVLDGGCAKGVQDAIAKGVDPQLKVHINGGADSTGYHKQDAWDGTFGDMTKICDQATKAASDAKEKREAPYRAVLKGDKLKYALDGLPEGYIMSGSSGWTNDPAQLASHDVWFLTHGSEEPCKGGDTMQQLDRYQFDKDGKLVKSTSKNYCGNPPAKAFK